MIASIANTSGSNWDEYQYLTIFATPCVHSTTSAVQNLTNLCWIFSFPDEQVGELPLAYVVKREHVDLTEAEVMSFVARIVRLENSNIGMNAIPSILEYCMHVLLWPFDLVFVYFCFNTI